VGYIIASTIMPLVKVIRVTTKKALAKC